MIHPRSTRHSVFAMLAAIALLVRVAIPTGFMPSSMDDGWYLQLCPDGMPAHVMVALFGEDHSHHGQPDEDTFFQCDYDSGVVGDAILDDILLLSSESAPTNLVAPGTRFLLPRSPAFGFRSRAPPHSFV